jgi:hypothetical protein
MISNPFVSELLISLLFLCVLERLERFIHSGTNGNDMICHLLSQVLQGHSVDQF